MCAKQSDLYKSINTSSDKDDSLDMHATLNKYRYHWPLFLIALFITLSLALIYLYFSNPVYKIHATILIQDENKIPTDKSTLQEIDLTKSPKLVENEIEVLKSRDLILKVVHDLALWKTYQKVDGFRKRDLYLESPVKFELTNEFRSKNRQSFEILLKTRNSYLYKNSNGEYKERNFNEAFQTNYGSAKLFPTENLDKFLGSKIEVILNPSDNVADRYQESIDVELLNKMAPAIGFSLRDKVEQRGKDFLRKLIENYTRATISEKNRITKTTLQFIDQRLALLATELNTTESEFEGFRSDRGLTDMSSQSKMYLQNVQSNDSRLNEVSIQLNVIEGVEKYVNSSQNDEYLPSTLGISDPALSSLIEKISLLQLQKNKLLATTPESNPLFDPIKTQINLTRAAIKENIKTLKSSLLDTKEELELFNKKFESSIKNIPGQERRLLSIQRQLAIKENLYVYLLQKKEELSLSYASTLPDSRIIDPPYSEPLKKHFQLFVLVGAILLGLLVPGGLIYIRDGFSNKITKAKEIEDAISAPIISELPFKRSSSSIVVLDNKNFEIGEQFRFLRTKLNLLHQRTEKGKVTLVSSSISGEGKSFVSSNLSVALAIAGKRTILIDLDLRKPELASIFDLQADHPGICDLLERNLTLKEIVQPSGIHSNLEIISTGNIPVNPSELLESASLDFFMKSLSLIYDHIIIDTAPVHLVTDALILSRFSGVMLYLIRQGETFKSLLPFIESVNTSKSFSNINIVFNGVEKLRYGYGDDYGGRYYQDMKVKKKNKGGKRLKDLFKRL